MSKPVDALPISFGVVFFLLISLMPVLAATPRDQIITQQMDLIEGVPVDQLMQGQPPIPTEVIQQPAVMPPQSVPTEPSNVQEQKTETVEQAPALNQQKIQNDPKSMVSSETSPKYALVKRVHTFDLGGDIYYNRYNEHDVDVFLMGTMLGYYGNYTYRPPVTNRLNNKIFNMYRLEGRYAQGKLDYKGSGVDKGQANRTFELRGLAGKDYMLEDGSRVTPYLGLGYRFLFDHGDGRFTSDGHIGYDRESHYFYVPIGVFVDIPMSQKRELTLNLEYDFFLQGVQKSELSDIQPFTPGLTQDARNHQDKGFGIRASFRLLKHFEPFDLYMEPFIRYWNIEDSKEIDLVIEDTLSTGLEPHNTTTEVGSKFGIQF